MTAYTDVHERRFYRDADRATLGGVCAGIADYFGFNLCVTRFLAVIAFLMAMPMVVVAYIAIVLLVPARSFRRAEARIDPEFRRNLRASPTQTMHDVRRRFQTHEASSGQASRRWFTSTEERDTRTVAVSPPSDSPPSKSVTHRRRGHPNWTYWLICRRSRPFRRT